jgi:formate dehydrogenase major subunit
MAKRKLTGILERWPVWKQLRSRDLTCLDENALSERSQELKARTAEADRVVGSICPFCGVGCGQLVYVKDEKILDIEGDPASPISRGRLCARGSSTFQLVAGTQRERRVLHRRPGATQWEEMPLEEAMERVAELVKKTRDETWEERTADGVEVNRTLGIAHLGGATLDNEENYLIKKLFTGGLGIVQVENQARI